MREATRTCWAHVQQVSYCLACSPAAGWDHCCCYRITSAFDAVLLVAAPPWAGGSHLQSRARWTKRANAHEQLAWQQTACWLSTQSQCTTSTSKHAGLPTLVCLQLWRQRCVCANPSHLWHARVKYYCLGAHQGGTCAWVLPHKSTRSLLTPGLDSGSRCWPVSHPPPTHTHTSRGERRTSGRLARPSTAPT